MVCLTNFLFFWVPFWAHNKIFYDRYVVGPAGQDLLEGLGEFENKWGFKLDDVWFGAYIRSKYGLRDGTPAFDDAAKKEFWKAYWQDPFFYWTCIAKRSSMLILPPLYAIYMKDSPFRGDGSYFEKIKRAFSSRALLWDFFVRHVYVRLFLLLGYLGAILLLVRRKYFALAIILSIIAGGFGKLPSHIEYRYLIPFYWIFALLVGFAIAEIYRALKQRLINALGQIDH